MGIIRDTGRGRPGDARRVTRIVRRAFVGVCALAGIALLSGCFMGTYEDSPGGTQRSTFVVGETVHVLALVEYTPGDQYQVCYYDGSGALAFVDVVTATAAGGGGAITSQWQTSGPAGTAHCVSYAIGDTPPSAYQQGQMGGIDETAFDLLDGSAITYGDAQRTVPSQTFDAGQIVYARLSGYLPNRDYQVAYYDASGALIETDLVTTDGAGEEQSSDWTSHNPLGVAHLVTFDGGAAVPATYGDASGLGIDDRAFSVNSPTLIRVTAARAWTAPEGLSVTWRAMDEGGIAGYNIWATSKRSRLIRLNRELVWARGSAVAEEVYRFGPVEGVKGDLLLIEQVRADGTPLLAAVIDLAGCKRPSGSSTP